MTRLSVAPRDDQQPLGQRVAKITLRVRDLPKSAGFFQRVLGCTKVAGSGSSASNGIVLALNESGELGVIELVAGRPINVTPAIESFTVEAVSAQALEEIHQRAVAEQVRLVPPRDHGDVRCCVLYDPDGHKIEVIARCNS